MNNNPLAKRGCCGLKGGGGGGGGAHPVHV